MRSRYSAFCIGDMSYLLATVHPDYRTGDDLSELERTFQQTHWLGLKIIEHKPGQEKATVEFVAFYRGQPFEQLHELSQFINEQGQWLYTTGDLLPPVKLGRNETCFCGSQKKYKNCHGKSL